MQLEQVSAELPTSADSVTLPAFAAERRAAAAPPLSVDISCRAHSSKHAVAATERWNRRTEFVLQKVPSMLSEFNPR